MKSLDRLATITIVLALINAIVFGYNLARIFHGV